ncbi:MAG: polysaccharide pyruvyl transferase family protein [Oscillospiraceae bacterium]|nr:polysaccharide pyruvyl transferase family protein [Oscillospiraceae bacterium]
MVKKLKKLVPEKLKLKIKLLAVGNKVPYWMDKVDKTKMNIFVFLAGFYQNLGDMAITYAQVEFLRKLYPDANIVAISSNQTYIAVKTIKHIINPNDIVTIIGGGNMSNMYQSLENTRLYVVNNFPNNRIISFPQSVDFSDTVSGLKSLEVSRKTYFKHKDLTIFTRESNSFERAKKYFPNVNIKICPDIVLSLNKVEPICERTDVICCLRSDKEQYLSNSEKQTLLSLIKEAFPDAIFTDTVDVALEDCTPERYKNTLESFWGRLRKGRVVITDRLHCMIFCAITGTPCVVFDNSNRKISGVYNQWIPNISYIKLFLNDEIEEAISEAKKLYNADFNITSFDLSDKFQELADAV